MAQTLVSAAPRLVSALGLLLLRKVETGLDRISERNRSALVEENPHGIALAAGSPGKTLTRRKSKVMPRTSRSRATPTADEIAKMASRGEDISACFTNKFTVVRPVQRINVDLTQAMLRELDARAARLNISREAVIKTLLRQALDRNRVSRASPRKRAV